jgi:hypothetical protein
MPRLLWTLSLCAVMAGLRFAAEAQIPPLPLAQAGAETELPLGAWGPYSRLHIGPCYLADRLLARLFAFPIVIGQRREEVVLRPFQTVGGKTRMRPVKVVLERRAMGLSPLQAENDDRADPIEAALNRQVRIVDANAEGLYWNARVRFAPAEVTQAVVPSLEGAGTVSAWGAGEATVTWFPAYADPDADGLLARVTLVNRSDAPQTYYIDLLGGMDVTGPAFEAKDLTIRAEPADGGVIVQHGGTDAVFALAGRAPFPIRPYQVGAAYFSPAGNVTERDNSGVSVPYGVAAGAAGTGNRAQGAGDSNSPPPNPQHPPAETQGAGNWGLMRVDDIAVAPRQSVTILLCIGTGPDEDTARASALTLLREMEDKEPNGKLKEGAIVKAQAAHDKTRFASGDSAVDRLMAQSLVNIPYWLARRVGVPTRQPPGSRLSGIYLPAAGGMTALGWVGYRPDWAAAQLNAFFLTRGDPDTLPRHPEAIPPTNLFALWELFQRTHDRTMLDRFYPFARRRYRELLTVGRPNEHDWLFSWPGDTDENAVFGGSAEPGAPPAGAKPAESRVCAPDYSAYVIRSARILRQMAEQLRRPKEELEGYERDATETARALNAALWDGEHGIYVSRPADTAGNGQQAMGNRQQATGNSETPTSSPLRPAPYTLASLLPLIAGTGALSPEQRAALLKHLTDPAAYWSAAGLRSVSKAAPAYRHGARYGGAVSIGANELLWKALLDLGEAETAHRLAEAVIQGYRHAQAASGGCPEWLDGDTGTAGGASDYSGDACALLPLYAAYHTPGTITTGWDIALLDSRSDRATDSLHIVFRNLAPAVRGVILCVAGKPYGKYTYSGSFSGSVTADANGVLTLSSPLDSTTQSLDIVPVPAAAPGGAQ